MPDFRHNECKHMLWFGWYCGYGDSVVFMAYGLNAKLSGFYLKSRRNRNLNSNSYFLRKNAITSKPSQSIQLSIMKPLVGIANFVLWSSCKIKCLNQRWKKYDQWLCKSCDARVKYLRQFMLFFSTTKM